MQEIEQLKVLQTEPGIVQITNDTERGRRRKQKTRPETTCRSGSRRASPTTVSGQNWSAKSCGLVIDDEFIDRGPEWRAFDADQRMKRARSGAPMTLTIHDKGLSTMIDWRNKDSYGRAISPRTGPDSTVSASGSAGYGSAMRPSGTLRSRSRNWTVWPPHWACRGTSARPPPWSTATRSTRT